MENLEKLLEEWDTDSNINSTEPGKELLNIPKLHSKYLKVLVKTRLKLKQIRNEYAELKKTRWNYYNGNYNTDRDKLDEIGLPPFKFILKQNIDIYTDSDKELLKYTDRIAYYEEMIKAIEAIMKELNNRVWELKEFVAWEKFIAGA